MIDMRHHEQRKVRLLHVANMLSVKICWGYTSQIMVDHFVSLPCRMRKQANCQPELPESAWSRTDSIDRLAGFR